MNTLRSFLSNESVFGRIMWRCGILIGANLMFVLCCIPVVTIGPGLAAMYHVLFKTLRGDGQIPFFRTWWQGFKSNFRQSITAWLALLLLAGFLLLEMFWCTQFPPPVGYFRYALLALLMVAAVIGIYLFPTMTAFRAGLLQLVCSSIFFAVGNPLHLILILFAHAAPLALTYLYLQILPLTAFLWCTVGFSGVAMLCASLLLRQFKPYLPMVDACGDIIEPGEKGDLNPGQRDSSEEATLAEMRKYGL